MRFSNCFTRMLLVSYYCQKHYVSEGKILPFLDLNISNPENEKNLIVAIGNDINETLHDCIGSYTGVGYSFEGVQIDNLVGRSRVLQVMILTVVKLNKFLEEEDVPTGSIVKCLAELYGFLKRNNWEVNSKLYVLKYQSKEDLLERIHNREKCLINENIYLNMFDGAPSTTNKIEYLTPLFPCNVDLALIRDYYGNTGLKHYTVKDIEELYCDDYETKSFWKFNGQEYCNSLCELHQLKF